MSRKIRVNQQYVDPDTKCAGEYLRHVRRAFENDMFPEDTTILVRSPNIEELSDLRTQAFLAIKAELASTDQIAAVLSRDSRTIWAFERDGLLVGGFAMLFLSRSGVAALHAATFNFQAPSHHLLVSKDETPAGIYWWALWGRGVMRGAFGRIAALLRQPELLHADLWAVPFTESGLHFMTNLGFSPFSCAQPGLLRYSRSPCGVTSEV